MTYIEMLQSCQRAKRISQGSRVRFKFTCDIHHQVGAIYQKPELKAGTAPVLYVFAPGIIRRSRDPQPRSFYLKSLFF
jgi:hypothetical protein